MNDLRDRLHRIAAAQGRERMLYIGIAATVVWIVLLLLFYFVVPAGDGQESGIKRLMSIIGIVLPVALIWLAVGFGRALSMLKEEALDLRATLAVMRQNAPDADIPRNPSIVRPPAPQAPRSAPAAQPQHDSDQASLELETPIPLELDEYELIAALNFPDGPEDEEAIRALRKALDDPELAKLIRAAQDIVTLLAKRNVFMDDLYSGTASAELWREFAEGARGAQVGHLALDADEGTMDTANRLLREDEVFRDVAHHFLRRFDRLITRAAPELPDNLLLALTYTRSGRAFTLLAQVTGMIGAAPTTRGQDA